MRAKDDKPAPDATVFTLSRGWSPVGTAAVLFPLLTIAGFFFVLIVVGVDHNIMLMMGVVFAFGAGGSLIAFGLPHGDPCIRAAFEREGVRVTGAVSGEAVLPTGSIELVVVRPPKTDRRAAPAYILYGSFGRLLLRPSDRNEAERLDAALRRSATRALHIPATEGVAGWKWPRRFDRTALEKALRWEAATRVRSSVIIGAVMTGTGLGVLGLFVGIVLGVLPPGNGRIGRAVGCGLAFLGFGLYLLITARRSLHWRDACIRMVNGRVHAPFPCPACGYDLGGLTVGAACPECGQIPPADVPLDLRAGM